MAIVNGIHFKDAMSSRLDDESESWVAIEEKDASIRAHFSAQRVLSRLHFVMHD